MRILKGMFFGSVLLLGFSWAEAAVQFSYSDHLGSAALVTNGAGEAQQIECYFPFGESVSASHPTLYTSHFLYTGQELDRASELYYYGARYYDPTLSRFISIDPVFDSPSPYAYVQNNPLSYIDPMGTDSKDPPGRPDLELLSDGALENHQVWLTDVANSLAREAQALRKEILEGGGEGRADRIQRAVELGNRIEELGAQIEATGDEIVRRLTANPNGPRTIHFGMLKEKDQLGPLGIPNQAGWLPPLPGLSEQDAERLGALPGMRPVSPDVVDHSLPPSPPPFRIQEEPPCLGIACHAPPPDLEDLLILYGPLSVWVVPELLPASELFTPNLLRFAPAVP